MRTARKEQYRYPVELLYRILEEGPIDSIFFFYEAGDAKDDRVLSILLQLLNNDDDDVREHALINISKLLQEDAGALCHAMLLDKSDKMRRCANVCLYRQNIFPIRNEHSLNINFLSKMVEVSEGDVLRNIIYLLEESQNKIVADLFLSLLHDDDRIIRKSAVEYLGNHGNMDFIEPIRTLLNDPDKDIRLCVITALGKLRDTSVVENAKELLSGDIARWSTGALTLYRVAEWSAKELVEFIQKQIIESGDKGDEWKWYHFIDLLFEVIDSDFIEPILEMAKNSNFDIRSFAEENLWLLDDKRAEELIIEIASSGEMVDQLRNLNNPAVLDVILTVLKEKPCYSREHLSVLRDIINVRFSEDSTLHPPSLAASKKDDVIHNQLKGKAGVEIINVLRSTYAIYDGLEDKSIGYGNFIYSTPKKDILSICNTLGDDSLTDIFKLALEDVNDFVRLNAAEYLSRRDSIEGFSALVELIVNSDQVGARWGAVRILANYADERILEQLLEYLKHDNDDIRFACTEVLGKLCNEQCFGAMLSLLEDDSQWVRASAAKALGMLDSRESLESLCRLLKDSSEHVRYRAAESLGYIGDEEVLPSLIASLGDDVHQVRMKVMNSISNII